MVVKMFIISQRDVSLLLLPVVVSFLLLSRTEAWWMHRQPPHRRRSAVPEKRALSSGTPRFAVEPLSLESLGDDHEQVGEELALSVRRWLDAEWMPQEVHGRVGESCGRTYVECRRTGCTDLISVMTATADDLTENWDAYDEDAFVNAWDITNYVSDYLTAKSGVEGCECSAKIY
jgi:hypothetical protein